MKVDLSLARRKTESASAIPEHARVKQTEIELGLAGCVLEQPDLASEVDPLWITDIRVGMLVEKAVQLGSKATPMALMLGIDLPEKVAFINQCQDAFSSVLEFPYLSECARNEYHKRRLSHVSKKFAADVLEANGNLPQLIAQMEADLYLQSPKSLATGPQELAQALTNDLEHRFENRGKHTGLTTGFPSLDRISDGLQFGEMTIIAARPSIGKTAIGLNFVHHACLVSGIPTLVISLEMSGVALCRRLTALACGIELSSIRGGRFTESDMPKLTAFSGRLSKAPIHIHDAPDGLKSIAAAALIRRYKKKHGIRLVVLDYLQKLKPDNRHEKKTYEVGESSGCIRAAAVETGVALVALAQLNRENEKDKGRMPRMSDLADSGQIERDADSIFLLHRSRSENPHLAKLIVAKQRDGETGIVDLEFDGAYCRFTELDHHERTPHND